MKRYTVALKRVDTPDKCWELFRYYTNRKTAEVEANIMATVDVKALITDTKTGTKTEVIKPRPSYYANEV